MEPTDLLRRVVSLHEAARGCRRAAEAGGSQRARFDRLCEVLVEVGGLVRAAIVEAEDRGPDEASYRRAIDLEGQALGALEVEAGHPLSPEEVQILDGIVEDLQRDLARQAASEAAALEARTLRAALDAAPPGLALVVDDKLAFVNKSGATILGLPPDHDFEGRRLTEVMGQESADAALARINRFLDGHEDAYPVVDRYARKGGGFRDVEIEGGRAQLDGRAGVVVAVHDVTEERQGELALRASEAKFRRVFEAANVGKSITLPTGEVNVNRAFAQMLGYTQEEMQAKTWQQITPAEDVARVEGLLQPILKGEQETLRMHKRYVHKDGSNIEADVSTVAWRDARGAVECFITTVVDITEQRRAEDELREARGRLEGALEIASMASWTYDGRTREFEFNDRFYALYGTSAEVEGGYRMAPDRYLERFVHPEDRELIGGIMMKSLSSPGVAFEDRREHRILLPSGAVRHVAVHFGVEVDEDGEVTRSYGANQDITAKKNAERQIVESEAFVREVMENLPIGVGVCTLEPEMVCAYTNGAFARLLSSSHERLMEPDAFWEAVFEDPTVRARFRARVLQDLADSSSGRAAYDNVVVVNGGACRHLSISFVPLKERALSIVLLRDVTARRRAEAERAQMEQQFLAAQRLEAVGRLAGGVAHDFNNLLSVIINYAEFLIDDLRDEDPMRDDVQEIMTAGKRAAALTRQLLAFSRRQVLQPEVLDLNVIVSGLERMLNRLLGEDIAIQIFPFDGAGRIMADPGQIEQVLMNLVINARDAMPSGGTLTVETDCLELGEDGAGPIELGPGKYMRMSVTDTGVGMDEQTRARIFEPFFTTKDKSKGTGLGLSTVYGIVQQSEGAIAVKSAPGEGTTFAVYLPCVSEDATPTEAAAPEVHRGTETVLVVEDEESVRRLTERILRSAGYRVLTAASGGDALVLCEKEGEEVDLLLTDVIMPQMSGVELSDRLRQYWPSLRVLYMSGYTDEAIGAHGVLAPGIKLVGKPFSGAELTKRVRESLDGKGAASG